MPPLHFYGEKILFSLLNRFQTLFMNIVMSSGHLNPIPFWPQERQQKVASHRAILAVTLLGNFFDILVFHIAE